MPKLTLHVLKETFAIHRLDTHSDIPSQVFNCPLFFIAKTHDELSIVVPQTLSIEASETNLDWRALEVAGPLDFSLVGIISKISAILAGIEVSVFVVSTFDTDYILVKSPQLQNATTALIQAGYTINE